MRIFVLAFLLVAALVPATACEKTCDGLADCGLDEICDRDGTCIATPERPIIPGVGEGEGEGEGEGGEGEGEGEGGEGEGEGEGNGGTCASSLTLDEDRVYLIGPLNDLGGGNLAIVDVEGQTDRYVIGFASFISGRIVAGDFIYTAFADTDAPLRFETDPHPLDEDGTFDEGSPLNCVYPEPQEEVYANDERLSEGCAGTNNLSKLAVASDGSFLMLCSLDNFIRWHREDGTIVEALGEDEVIALSPAGLALTRDKIVDIETGTVTTFSEPFPFVGQPRARTLADRFLVALIICSNGAPEGHQIEVSFNGVVDFTGTYPADAFSDCNEYVMLPDGDVMIAGALVGESSGRHVYRVAPGGTPALVYDNSLDPPVDSDFGPMLFTGP
jgi:hypothetical protein